MLPFNFLLLLLPYVTIILIAFLLTSPILYINCSMLIYLCFITPRLTISSLSYVENIFCEKRNYNSIFRENREVTNNPSNPHETSINTKYYVKKCTKWSLNSFTFNIKHVGFSYYTLQYLIISVQVGISVQGEYFL